MELLIGIIIVVIILLVIYTYQQTKEKPERTYEEFLEKTADEDIIEPLTNVIFNNAQVYADKKQDSRTDAIIKEMRAIHFWIIIIGLYALIKLIQEITTLLMMIAAGKSLLDIINCIY